MATSMKSPLENFDPLRDGLRNMKEECRSGHEVEQMQKELQSEGFSKSLKSMQQVYGLALPARMQIEAQIVNKTRLGLPSSRLALDTLLGRLDEISPETYLGLPENNTEMVDYREVIEQQRGVRIMPKRF